MQKGFPAVFTASSTALRPALVQQFLERVVHASASFVRSMLDASKSK
jgi:hypothetical protein